MSSPRSSAIPFVAIPAISILFGFFLNYMIFHKGPGSHMPSIMKQSTKELIKNLGVDLDTSLASKIGIAQQPGFQHWIPTKVAHLLGFNDQGKILWLLVSFFEVALERSLGQSTVLLVLGITAPLLLKCSLESVKPRAYSSALLGALTLILFTGIGQIITIACATNFFFVPIYSFAKFQSGVPQTQAQASKFDSFPLFVVCAVNSLAGLVFLLTTFVPIKSEYWVLSNIVFQFFPLAFLPLIFTPRSKGNQTSTTLTASVLYRQVSYFCAFVYLLSIYLALPQVVEASEGSKYSLLAIIQNLIKGLNDGEWLLLFDSLGMLGASILILLVDHFSHAYDKEIKTKISPRFSLVLLLGPGFVLADYMARNEEVSAEKKPKKE